LKRHGPELHFVIEYAGVGISLHQWLCKERRHSFSFTPKEGKAMRAARVVPFFEEGRVAVLNRAGHNTWVEPWLNEFMSFPFGRHDDQVDSFCQLLGWAMKRYHPDTHIWFG
jgi:predicted phage terminase large subunit-like protein